MSTILLLSIQNDVLLGISPESGGGGFPHNKPKNPEGNVQVPKPEIPAEQETTAQPELPAAENEQTVMSIQRRAAIAKLETFGKIVKECNIGYGAMQATDYYLEKFRDSEDGEESFRELLKKNGMPHTVSVRDAEYFAAGLIKEIITRHIFDNGYKSRLLKAVEDIQNNTQSLVSSYLEHLYPVGESLQVGSDEMATQIVNYYLLDVNRFQLNSLNFLRKIVDSDVFSENSSQLILELKRLRVVIDDFLPHFVSQELQSAQERRQAQLTQELSQALQDVYADIIGSEQNSSITKNAIEETLKRAERSINNTFSQEVNKLGEQLSEYIASNYARLSNDERNSFEYNLEKWLNFIEGFDLETQSLSYIKEQIKMLEQEERNKAAELAAQQAAEKKERLQKDIIKELQEILDSIDPERISKNLDKMRKEISGIARRVEDLQDTLRKPENRQILELTPQELDYVFDDVDKSLDRIEQYVRNILLLQPRTSLLGMIRSYSREEIEGIKRDIEKNVEDIFNKLQIDFQTDKPQEEE